MSLNESHVEDAALTWFGELGYAVGHGPHIAPGEPAAERDSFGEVVLTGRLRETIREPAAERDSFGEVVLTGRLRETIRRMNPPIPEEARAVIRNSRTTRFERSSR